jgi:hypothetical protein
MIGLPTRLIGGPELLLLLGDDVATLVGPLRCLVARFPRPVTDVFAAFLSARAQGFPGLVARPRRIE